MNIDNNEQPEPTEEYPSHMVEETADEEEITDHQTVADILSEGEIYPNLTIERLREVVEEVLEEADQAESTEPHPTQVLMDGLEANEEIFPPPIVEPQPRAVQTVDVANIPVGMSAAEYVRHYQDSGTLLTQATAVDASYQGTTADGVNTTIRSSSTDVTGGQPFAVIEDEQKPDKEDVPVISPEIIAELKKEKRILQISQTKCKESITINDMTLGPNDLIISFSVMQRGILHSDLENEMSTRKIVKNTKSLIRRRRGSNIVRGSSSQLVFDKNGNRLVINADVIDEDGRRKTRRDVPRIHLSQALSQASPLNLGIDKFVIIDKDAFIGTQGVIWKIRYRSSTVTMKRLMEQKRKIRHYFTEMEHGLNNLRIVMSRQFAEEDYEIIYNLDFVNNFNRFQLMGRFTDITIRNSIEIERYIGDMIVSKDGNHLTGFLHEPELKIKLGGYVYGTRMTFTPSDAVLKYSHSHLTSGMQSNMSFCTGSESYRGADTYDSELDIEMVFVRLKEFIQWESLEGGPHMRMEEQSIHGSRLSVHPHELHLDNVHHSYKLEMIKKIRKHEQGFAVFKDCFILQADKRGNLRYVTDFPKFYEIFISLITKKELEDISRRGMEPVMTYKPGGNFYKIRDRDLSNPMKLQQRALNELKSLVPLYFNGRYVRPHLIPERASESVIFSPNPFFMRDLAKYIQYNLIQQLEHGSRDKS